MRYSCPIHGNNWLKQICLVAFHGSMSRVRVMSKMSVTLDHRSEGVLQDGPHRVAHSSVEFAVLTGLLDKVLVKDEAAWFENHDRG
jgi:hypothetical protein